MTCDMWGGDLFYSATSK